jgi:hypothetical protein
MNAVSGWALGRSRAQDPGILCPQSDRQRVCQLLLLHDLLQHQKRKGPLPYRERALTCGN